MTDDWHKMTLYWNTLFSFINLLRFLQWQVRHQFVSQTATRMKVESCICIGSSSPGCMDGSTEGCLQLNCISSYFILRLKYWLRAGWSTIRRNEDVNVNRFEEIVWCRPQIGLRDDTIFLSIKMLSLFLINITLQCYLAWTRTFMSWN